MKKKIAILYSGAEHWGGVETYLDNLLSEENKDIDFYLLSFGRWELTDKLKDKVAVKIFGRARVNPFRAIKIGFYLKKNNVGLLMSQGVVANVYARLASVLFRIPNVCVVHSDLANEYKNPLIKNIYIFSDWFLRKVTRKFITVSEYMKSVLVKRGIDDSKIKVIHNGIKFSRDYSSSGVERSREAGGRLSIKSSDKIVVGSVGRLSHEKGYDLLIEAAKYLPQNMEIRICGEGRERGKLTELIEKNELTEKVKLLGFCKNTADFYNSLDLYVQPSRSEGFGLAVLEALKQYVPVLVSAEGALPELVFQNKTFIFKDLSPETISEKIKYSLENIEELKKETLELKKKAEKEFGYERWLKETTEELKNI